MSLAADCSQINWIKISMNAKNTLLQNLASPKSHLRPKKGTINSKNPEKNIRKNTMEKLKLQKFHLLRQ